VWVTTTWSVACPSRVSREFVCLACLDGGYGRVRIDRCSMTNSGDAYLPCVSAGSAGRACVCVATENRERPGRRRERRPDGNEQKLCASFLQQADYKIEIRLFRMLTRSGHDVLAFIYYLDTCGKLWTRIPIAFTYDAVLLLLSGSFYCRMLFLILSCDVPLAFV
jgi:hypothetical protein